VVKEGLANAMKNAAATKIRVTCNVEPGALVVRMKDNGLGFDPTEKRAAGNGLGNMLCRMADLGGEFGICSAPGEGTILKIRVPLRSKP
jgi:signal transduction histidine kinase